MPDRRHFSNHNSVVVARCDTDAPAPNDAASEVRRKCAPASLTPSVLFHDVHRCYKWDARVITAATAVCCLIFPRIFIFTLWLIACNLRDFFTGKSCLLFICVLHPGFTVYFAGMVCCWKERMFLGACQQACSLWRPVMGNGLTLCLRLNFNSMLSKTVPTCVCF